MQITVRMTAEELFNEKETVSADADIAITFDMQPEERRTMDYPGHPATAELVSWELEHYTLYNQETGNAIDPSCWDKTPQWLLSEIEEWVNDNEHFLTEEAFEKSRNIYLEMGDF